MRFKICSVTGYGNGQRKFTSVWYVLDSANCYRIVESFVGAYRRRGVKVTAEGRARELAAQLEVEYP